MPKTRKIRLPASSIIVPSSDDIANYGSPAYVASDFSDAGLTYLPAIDHATIVSAVASIAGEPATFKSASITLAGDTLFSLYDAETGLADYPAGHEAFAAPVQTFEPATDAAPATDADNTPPVTVSLSDTQLAKLAAAKAVSAFYAGASLPFKAAATAYRLADINVAHTPAHTQRNAAALACILLYCDIQPDGTFRRGSAVLSGRLLGYTGTDAERTFAGAIESGSASVLCANGVLTFVSGVPGGKSAENQIFRINYDPARALLRQHNSKQADGEHLFSATLGLLDLLASPVTSAPVTSADNGLPF